MMKGFRIRKKVVKAVLCVAAIALVFALAVVLASKLENRIFPEAEKQAYSLYRAVEHNGATYVPNDNLDLTLVIGVDDFGQEEAVQSYVNTSQSDFLLLMIRNTQQNTYSAIQLNRDTMTQIPVLGVTGQQAGYIDGQLALAHTYGSGKEDSCRNTVKAVSKLLDDIIIDHYVSMSMECVSALNDWVGGVTLTVQGDFSKIDTSLTQGETVTLKGDQALTYVRARSGMADDATNIARMERQRQYIVAWAALAEEKAKSDDAVGELVADISGSLVSDCTVNQLSRFVEDMSQCIQGTLYTIPGEAVKGKEFMEFYVDEDALSDLIFQVFYEKVEK